LFLSHSANALVLADDGGARFPVCRPAPVREAPKYGLGGGALERFRYVMRMLINSINEYHIFQHILVSAYLPILFMPAGLVLPSSPTFGAGRQTGYKIARRQSLDYMRV